ncbi:MAG TPA: AAA family ATPase [Gammaproteobacteria bacterium]|nr:AAA family ATPase [Gammaproteobacteria bacterium]
MTKTSDLQHRLFPAPAGMEDLYRNTAFDMLAASVLQQAPNTSQIQVIKGEYGIGKTSFCKRMQYEAAGNLNVFSIQAHRKTGIAEILHVIAGAKEDDTRAPLQVLAKNAAQKIYQQLYNDLQPVLLIDDAHCLSAQTLANLFRFQNAIAQQNTGGLKLILVGERKIDSRLEHVDRNIIDRDRFLSSLLRPLTRNEIGDYIDFKLARAQGEKPKLNGKQLQYLRKQSGGLPGKVEELYVRALQGKTSNKSLTLAALCMLFLAMGGLAWHYKLYEPGQLQQLLGNERKPARIKKPAQTPAAPARPAAPPVETPEAPAEPAPETGDISAAPATDAFNSLAWLTEQPAEFYLIQLVGGHDPAKLENYRQSLDLPHPLTLHKTERNGQDWYLLFYGPFPDYESAFDARAQLPLDLRKNQPWIRQIGSILEKQ